MSIFLGMKMSNKPTILSEAMIAWKNEKILSGENQYTHYTNDQIEDAIYDEYDYQEQCDKNLELELVNS